MTNVKNKMENTRKITANVGNLKTIIYIENTSKNHLKVHGAYHWLKEDGPKFFVFREDMAGLHLSPFNTYSSVLCKNKPKSVKEFLQSVYIAIPITNNEITSELYKHYYIEEIPAGQTPEGLSNASLLFSKLKEGYTLKASAPMLINFIEAYLNTEKAGVTDLKSYSRLLLYNYIEHVSLFDQYMTYEQKGMEIVRNDLAFNCMACSFHAVTLQLIEDIGFFLLTEHAEASSANFTIQTGQNKVSLLDNKLLLESLEFFNRNQDLILNEVASVPYRDYNPRTTYATNSMELCKQSLLNLKEILLRRDG